MSEEKKLKLNKGVAFVAIRAGSSFRMGRP
jgi:hypothetical protein